MRFHFFFGKPIFNFWFSDLEKTKKNKNFVILEVRALYITRYRQKSKAKAKQKKTKAQGRVQRQLGSSAYCAV